MKRGQKGVLSRYEGETQSILKKVFAVRERLRLESAREVLDALTELGPKDEASLHLRELADALELGPDSVGLQRYLSGDRSPSPGMMHLFDAVRDGVLVIEFNGAIPPKSRHKKALKLRHTSLQPGIVPPDKAGLVYEARAARESIRRLMQEGSDLVDEREEMLLSLTCDLLDLIREREGAPR